MDIFYTGASALKYLIISGGIWFVYTFSRVAAVTTRSGRNPSWVERIKFMIKGAGVLLLVAMLITSGGPSDEDPDADVVPEHVRNRHIVLILLTGLPVMVMGMTVGYSQEKNEL